MHRMRGGGGGGDPHWANSNLGGMQCPFLCQFCTSDTGRSSHNSSAAVHLLPALYPRSPSTATCSLFPASSRLHPTPHPLLPQLSPSSCSLTYPSLLLPLSPPLSHSQESRVPVAASCTRTDLTFVENPFSSKLPHQLTTAQDYPLFSANRQLPMLPPRTQQQQEEEVYSHIQLPVAPSVQRSAAGFTSDRRLRVSPLQKKSPLFDQVKERIYSEAASLVSENETHPYYLMELLRAAQLLGSITFSAYKYNSILF